jgi:hypothetical protein
LTINKKLDGGKNVQAESIKQSLLLWGQYKLKEERNEDNKEKLKRNMKIIEDFLEKANVEDIQLGLKVLNGYEVSYKEKDIKKVMAFRF